MKAILLSLVLSGLLLPSLQGASRSSEGPIRVLFLGHESEHHHANRFYPMLARALGREAIYFDYVTRVDQAFGDASYLAHFDVVLLYANHATIDSESWRNLKAFIDQGGGFVPVHCASSCFSNEPEFEKVVGARFDHHKTGIFRPRTLLNVHSLLHDLPEMEAWDETYVHRNHQERDRIVLQVRMPEGKEDNIQEPEPWTWIRNQGKGRVFYTASGHDERVWSRPEFHQLLRRGILWAAGEKARQRHANFLAGREPVRYEKRADIPNYEKRPEPLPYQFPLSARESLKHTQVPAGFRLELFAAEPDIVNPIAMAWDHRGRLWVAETVDYPNGIQKDRKGHDRIKILEDRNGDGRCDHVQVFAEGLNIPTSITFTRGGLLVAQAPDFLLLKDTDGDDVADQREVVLSGWGIGDTHAGPSNLRLGLDNWIWGTVGYARFTGEVAGRRQEFGMGVFRFRPDGSALEFLHQFNNNTWGLGFNLAGDVFGSTANNNPSFFGGFPATGYSGRPGVSARMIADSPEFHPITPNIRQVDAFGHYTSACGHALATSDAFPPAWRDRMAFVCGPTGHLLGGYLLEPDGAGYRARNAFSIVASSDEWFSPIAAEVGPDGHLWIADWYNFILQHNPTPTKQRGGYAGKNGPGNAHENPNRDREHGRIYRLVWEGAKSSPMPSLDADDVPGLLAALDHPNLFWRQTAQRLLVEGAQSHAIPALVNRLAGPVPGAIHALWALEGLSGIEQKWIQSALIHPDDRMKQNAVRAIPASDAMAFQWLYDSATLASTNLSLRREAFVKLAQLPTTEVTRMAATELLKDGTNAEDEWLSLALHAAGATDKVVTGIRFGPNLLSNGGFEVRNDRGEPAGWRFRNYSGDAGQVIHGIETRPEFVRSGRYSLRLESPKGNDTSLFTSLKLKPETEYRLSAWLKTREVTGGMGALLNLHELQRNGATSGLQGTHDWTGIQKRFTTDSRTEYTLNCLLGGWGEARGAAWYDDITLEEVLPLMEDRRLEPVKGLAERGRRIFLEHQVAACIRCHALEGQGGVVGPPMDDIALRKDRHYILESLVNPAATLAEGYDQISASPMPPMNLVLKEQELADVLEFLMTLKNPVQPLKPDPAGTVFE